jgi:flagellar motility protein MotE (MotC chaperone)
MLSTSTFSKLRNRLSQQAFRARQNLEINELKQQLALFSGSESDRNASLVAENQRLRQLLWQSEKKLRSLQASLKGVLDSMAEARDGDFVSSIINH